MAATEGAAGMPTGRSAGSESPGTLSIRGQLLRECRAMARYAFAAGRPVPGPVVQALESLSAPGADAGAAPSGRTDAANGVAVAADARTAAGTGPVAEAAARAQASAPGAEQVPALAARKLAQVHARLAQIVAPATPRTVLLLAEETARNSAWLFLGPVPLIRRLMLVAILSLCSLIAVSLSSAVDGNPESFSLLHNNGLSLLLNELFLLSAASIGACFAGLFQASRYVQLGTFDPAFESSYWIRYVLGLMAGIMLASLIPIEDFSGGASGEPASSTLQGLGKPTLALLGGFSAAVVHRILYRLVTAIESLVRGDARSSVTAEVQAAKSRGAEELAQTRMQMSAALAQLQQRLGTSGEMGEVMRELSRMQNDLAREGLPDDSEFEPASPPQKTGARAATADDTKARTEASVEAMPAPKAPKSAAHDR